MLQTFATRSFAGLKNTAATSAIFAAIGIGFFAGSVTPAGPASPNKFDGRWSIEVITQAGTCDKAYRYAVLLDGGEARYGGQESITINGRVSPAGAVKGSIAYQDKKAEVVGQLSGNFGAGTWTYHGGQTCSGRWNAERRG